MSEHPEIQPVHLSAEESDRDDVHRLHCRDSLCGDIAHRYRRALLAGQVFVDNIPYLDYQQRKQA